MSVFSKDHLKVLLAAKSCLVSFSVLDELFCSEQLVTGYYFCHLFFCYCYLYALAEKS